MRFQFALGFLFLGTWNGLAFANWPGTFIWQPHRAAVSKKSDRIEHRGEIKWVAKYHELALNQPRDYERTRAIAWDYTREVLAVRNGRSERDQVSIKSWQWIEQDGLADRSLTGYRFKIRNREGSRNPQVIKRGPEKMSPQAAAWSRHNLMGHEEALLVAVRPREKHLRPGQTWVIDPLKVAIVLQIDTLSRVDPKKSKLVGRLEKPRLIQDVFVGRYVIEGSIFLGQFPKTKVAWTSGGLLDLKIVVAGPLEAIAVAPYTIEISGHLVGSAQIRGSGGESIMRDLDWRMEGQWTRSGP